ncbi:hypothetical protein FDECE_6684 [Fusarium decemcellulare]|nr:hypothetical protein FDECE_6684 [Fusarium decemcellulare]
MSASPTASGPGGAVDEAFIMRLPDEILSRILDFAGGTIFKVDTFWGSDYFSKTTVALATGWEGTAPFTALKLYRFTNTTRDLDLVLKWPAKLEELYFHPRCIPGGGTHWSFWRLQPMLDIHKSTLRKITIPELDEGDITNLDLSDYPNLEILELPATLTGKDVANIPRLVAPRLRVFRWNIITWRTESRVQPEDFDQAEEDWLRAFVQAAVERKVKLRQIFVNFVPTLLVGLLVDARYPWDRMDDVGRDVAQHGVKVGYLSPSITREEFNRARWVKI